jgi:hypothetical protein
MVRIELLVTTPGARLFVRLFVGNVVLKLLEGTIVRGTPGLTFLKEDVTAGLTFLKAGVTKGRTAPVWPTMDTCGMPPPTWGIGCIECIV